MAQSVRRSFNRKDKPGTEEELRRQAAETVRDRNERAFKSLVEVQGRELKLLESERVWIEQQKALDVSPMNNKEISGINQRYDRLQHEMQRKHNSFFGKLHRVFGGHKQQQKQLNTLNGERNRVVAERAKQHVEREGQRQRSLTERHLRIEKELQDTKERQAVDRDQFRQQREQGFEPAVAKEIYRLRMQPKQRM